jgi:hypothetical protein
MMNEELKNERDFCAASRKDHDSACEKALAACEKERDGLRSQLAAIPDIYVQEAALVGDNMILTQQLAECERERDELMDTIRQIGWDTAHIDAAIAKVEKGMT